jgi:hypothetical protein
MNATMKFSINGNELGWTYIDGEVAEEIVKAMSQSKNINVEITYYERSQIMSLEDLKKGLSNGGNKSMNFDLKKKEVRP